MARMAGAHLIGSVPLQDAETVFRTLADQLGPWLARMPDGETGERSRWIWWQHEMLLRHPAMEIDPTVPPQEFRQWDGQLLRMIGMLRLRPGIDLSGVMFETGYAAAALSSYAAFRKLRDVGRIPAGMRFQVCLPTPMASAYMYVSGPGRAAYLPVYERALRTALRDILNGIPHGDLSIQWDVCQEVLVFENYFPDRPKTYAEDVFTELSRLGDAVPESVECGYHLCYGSPRDEHLAMPKDMGVLVAMTEGLLKRLHRQLDFIHLPVPKDRTDDSYFAPLRELVLPAETALYLGLISENDAAGDAARIAAARRAVPAFGIATECGWGRKDPARVPGLIAAHKAALEAMS